MGVSALRLLGPVEVLVDETTTGVGGRNAKIVLGTLALEVNRAVSADYLMWAIWGDDEPASAPGALQSYISRLRGLLGSEAIIRVDHSYLLRIDPMRIDLVEYEHLAHIADRSIGHDPAAAEGACIKASQLWRGQPFGGIADLEPFHTEAHRLEELRRHVMELRLEAEVMLGRAAEAVPELEAATHEFPYRERLWYLLMEALSVEGRRVEAIRAYEELRVGLAEVGLDPSRDLSELVDRILVEDASVRAHLGHPTS